MTILLLSDTVDGPWYTADATLTTDAQKRGLAGRDCTVIVAGQTVRILPHTLPTLRARERDSAARFHVEPLVGDDVAALHIAVGPDRLAVIRRARMDAIVASLSDAGVVPAAIHADFDVLPPATLPDRIVLASATLDRDFPLDGDRPGPMDPQEAAERADTAGAINLLSGDYAKRRFANAPLSATWLRPAAAVLAAMGVSWFALQGVEARAERLQVEDLRDRAATAYFDATGVESRQPARDASRLSAAPTDPGALELTALLFEAMKTVDGVSIESLDYRQGEAELDLVLAYPGFAATSQMEAAAARVGATLSAGGVRENDGRYIGQATFAGAR